MTPVQGRQEEAGAPEFVRLDVLVKSGVNRLFQSRFKHFKHHSQLGFNNNFRVRQMDRSIGAAAPEPLRRF